MNNYVMCATLIMNWDLEDNALKEKINVMMINVKYATNNSQLMLNKSAMHAKQITF